MSVDQNQTSTQTMPDRVQSRSALYQFITSAHTVTESESQKYRSNFNPYRKPERRFSIAEGTALPKIAQTEVAG